MPTAAAIEKHLRSLGNPQGAQSAARFFKTGPGQYGEGDRFLGLGAAALHRLAKENKDVPLTILEELLHSSWHEVRTLSLLVMVRQVAKAEDELRKEVYDLYLANTRFVNNWDLVDCSAPQLVGAYLFPRSRKPLHRLARSKSLWERRIAMVATQYFIRQGDFEETLKLAAMLCGDREDLIHKATGWMLREVGKRDVAVLEKFLKEKCQALPRTALRYAIERFAPEKRQMYLKGITQ